MVVCDKPQAFSPRRTRNGRVRKSEWLAIGTAVEQDTAPMVQRRQITVQMHLFLSIMLEVVEDSKLQS